MLTDAYKILLNVLTIKDHHLENLQKRGFDLQTIASNGYKSWPYKKAQLVDEFLRQYPNPHGVPGFFKEKDGAWQVTGSAGMLIPVRDFNGDIRSFKIRMDGEKAIGKYQTLSSNPKGKDGGEKHPWGTAANISIHYPLTNKEFSSKTLIITEGEIKADLVNFFKKESYCISLPGVGMWDWGVEAAKKLKPKKILIAFDADKNKECSTSKPEKTPFVVAKSLAMLYTTLKQSDFDVHILDWPEDCGKGIDDVLSKGFEDKIIILDDDKAKEFCEVALKNDMPMDWVYVIDTRRFNHTFLDIQLSREQFNDRYDPWYPKKSPSDVCLKLPNFPRVDKQCYKPAELPIFEKDGLKYLNIWRPANIERVQGDVSPFLNHLKYILPAEYEKNILLDWMAYMVQNPGKKMMWSIMVQGKHGTGKSYIGKVLECLLGSYNVSFISSLNLKVRFNTWFKHCCLVVVNELMIDGKISIMNSLKSYITDSPIFIEEKGVNIYPQENVSNFLFFSNYKNAITIERTERRYCVFYSPAEPEQDEVKKKDYFDNLFGWTYENIGKVYDYLMQRDLTHFNAQGDAPVTEARMELLKSTGGALEHWIAEELELGNKPFNTAITSINIIMDHMPNFIRGVTPVKVGKILAKLGAECLGQYRVNTGQRLRLWVIRDNFKWKNMNSDAVLNEYDLIFKNESIGNSHKYMAKQF
jgi:hypothetical protein